MKAALVVGARPQFVKAAALLPALRARGDTRFIRTGQHTDPTMVDAQFASLGLPRPDRRLLAGGGRAQRLGGLVRDLADTFAEEQVDRVVVMGDTDSTLAGALAASFSGIPLVHVEAGARSGERDLPEERNRIVVDQLSDLLLCSTEAHAAQVDGGVCVGDVMADVLMARESSIRAQSPRDCEPYAVLTLHRAGNVDNPGRVSGVLAGLAGAGMRVIYPKHPRLKRTEFPAPVEVVAPLPYHEFLALVAGADFVLTDSGGLQKEAYLLGVPCITLRDATEWGGTVDAGWNVLVGTDPKRIAAAVDAPPRAETRPALFGDGHAAERIAALVQTVHTTTFPSA